MNEHERFNNNVSCQRLKSMSRDRSMCTCVHYKMLETNKEKNYKNLTYGINEENIQVEVRTNQINFCELWFSRKSNDIVNLNCNTYQTKEIFASRLSNVYLLSSRYPFSNCCCYSYSYSRCSFFPSYILNI